MAARGNSAHPDLAKRRGAQVFDNCAIERVSSSGAEIAVVTAQGEFRCQRQVVTTGAWSNQTYLSAHIPD